MYMNLKIAFIERDIDLNKVADTLGIHRNTLSNKINGKGRFYIDELLTIRDVFLKDFTIDALSVRKNNIKTA